MADEAHQIKNSKSNIGRLLGKIQTGSRVATTGSPLSNHLQEYWAMMNWIHPGFLGTLQEFSAQYIKPIKEGLYADSSYLQRRESQKCLVKLKTVLDDKLHRRDLKVIEADLPPKTEFVIYVPLTQLQRRLYEGLLNKSVWDKTSYKNTFTWINILRLICNHPVTLIVQPGLVMRS